MTDSNDNKQMGGSNAMSKEVVEGKFGTITLNGKKFALTSPARLTLTVIDENSRKGSWTVPSGKRLISCSSGRFTCASSNMAEVDR